MSSTIINHLKTHVNYRNCLSAGPPLTFSVTTTSQMVLPQNNDRVGLIVVNLSDTEKVYLGIGYDAVVNSGVTLLPNVGWKLDDYTFFVTPLYAIADVDGVQISIQEFSQ